MNQIKMIVSRDETISWLIPFRIKNAKYLPVRALYLYLYKLYICKIIHDLVSDCW